MSTASQLLGKSVSFPKSYCPEILVAVPRAQNREIYGIHETNLPFYGFDSWHAYETGFILDNGMPVTGLMKMIYPSDSRCIVESKSLKLYLGSYNMTPMGKDKTQAISQFEQRVEKDLSELLSSPVKVCFYAEPATSLPFDFAEYSILEDQLPAENLHFSVYTENPALLAEDIRCEAGELKVGSHLLKSNCKITNQPDWGSIYIHLKGQSLPSVPSLLKYIVSMRNENHFHEEICEMTYKRLTDVFHPDILMVSCLYTRRGGIDICPSRANHPDSLPQNLIQANTLTQRTFRQ